VDTSAAQKLDYNKLYQASVRNKGLQGPLPMPDHMKKHPDFHKHVRVFFEVSESETSSQFGRNQGKFFAEEDKMYKQIGENFMNLQTSVQVNKDSEVYQRNTSKFYG
jgi:hypothetical protein